MARGLNSLHCYVSFKKISPTTPINGFVGTSVGTVERLVWNWGDGNTNEFLDWGYRKAPIDPSDPNTAWEDKLTYSTEDMQWVWVNADPNITVNGKAWPGGYT